MWYFGTYAGVNFNTNPPSALSNSAMQQDEGSASICDNNGQVLFYTDGDTIWNRNHTVMQNGTGLLGDASSTQSALIIPLPGTCNIYYIFTSPQQYFAIPLSYSIVDMTMDGGLGAITTKNISIHFPVTEKLTATLKNNGIDYWVIAKEYNTGNFLSYSLTSAGLDMNPVISPVGSVPSVLATMGYIKVSPDGSKFASAEYWPPLTAQLYDFDNNTGIISNRIDLSFSDPGFDPYGVEFSPDNSKLYVQSNSGASICQFDITGGSAAIIQNSAVIIVAPDVNSFGGAIMLGPDNKIYSTVFTRQYLSIIDQPNLAGLACNYIPQAIQLTGSCTLGLPNEVRYPPVPPAIHNNSNAVICYNQTYQLPWGPIVNTPGIYLDTIKSITCNDSIITSINLTLFPVSYVNSSAQICSNQTYQLPSGTIVSAEGIYSDTLRSQASCDSIINTIHLLVNNVSSASHIDSIDAGQTYTLPSGTIVNSAGTYQSILANSLGCDSVITTILSLRKSLPECLSLKNIFTPNGDGINDKWILYTYNCFKKLEVSVYNRYGSLVYHSDDYKNDWMGTYKNKPVPDGTYYYVIKLTSFDGKEYIFKDNVTILR